MSEWIIIRDCKEGFGIPFLNEEKPIFIRRVNYQLCGEINTENGLNVTYVMSDNPPLS